jgi:hypothetical protein
LAGRALRSRRRASRALTILMSRLKADTMTTGLPEPISFTPLRSVTYSMTTKVPATD